MELREGQRKGWRKRIRERGELGEKERKKKSFFFLKLGEIPIFPSNKLGFLHSPFFEEISY